MILRLQDSPKTANPLDRFAQLQRVGLIHCQHEDTNPDDEGAAGGGSPDDPPAKTDPPDDDEVVLDGPLDEEKAKKAIADSKRYKRKFQETSSEAKKLREENEAFRKEKEKQERDKLDEVERLKLEREEARKEAAEARAEAAHQKRSTAVALAGAKKGKCATFVAEELALAEAEDPSLDRDKWLAEFREESPEFFSKDKPAASTAAGGPNTVTTSESARTIAEYEDLLKHERNPNKRIDYKRAIRRLREKSA